MTGMDVLTDLVDLGDGGHARTFEAEIDSISATDLRVCGVLRDASFALEHAWILRTPAYEVIEASAPHVEESPALSH